MKKIIIFLISAILITGCTQQYNGAQIANPSATYCIDQGYTYEIRNFADGDSGFCIFNDLTECEAWAYYNGECTLQTASHCKDLCGDGECQEIVCEAIGCPCAETPINCPTDCA